MHSLKHSTKRKTVLALGASFAASITWLYADVFAGNYLPGNTITAGLAPIAIGWVYLIVAAEVNKSSVEMNSDEDHATQGNEEPGRGSGIFDGLTPIAASFFFKNASFENEKKVSKRRGDAGFFSDSYHDSRDHEKRSAALNYSPFSLYGLDSITNPDSLANPQNEINNSSIHTMSAFDTGGMDDGMGGI